MDRDVDAESGAFDFPFPNQPRAVVTDLHEAASIYFRPVRPDRDFGNSCCRCRHAEGEMVKNSLNEAVHDREAMRGGKVRARLPPSVGQTEFSGFE